MFIPDPDLDFISIPDPGVKKTPDTRSVTLARTKRFNAQKGSSNEY
jgi:hypothetical protein